MDYYEFVCAGTYAMSVAALHPDPAYLPDAALACCRQWRFRKAFRLGDGSHSVALDAAIEARVATDGYYFFSNGVDARRTRESISS
jgi:hypothetical protein